MPFRESWVFIGGFLVLVGYAMAMPTLAGVGFVIFVIGAVTRYWSRHMWDRVEFTRRLSQSRVFIDEPFDLDITLKNAKWLPLPWYDWSLTVSDPVRVEGEVLAAQAVPGFSYLRRKGALGWYAQDHWRMSALAVERGYHQVGPGTVSSSDLLGMFQGKRFDADMERLIVYPRVYSLQDMGLPADRPFGDQKGRERIFEDPLRIAGLREYRPGDPLKRIDWKATARHQDLLSKVYEPSATRQLYVLLNIDTLANSWEGYLPEELEQLVSVAASIAYWAHGERYAVGLLANGAFPEADRPMRLPPSRSPDQLGRLLEALAVIQPLTTGDLASAIQKESGRMPLGSTLVVVAAIVPPPLAAVLLRLAAEGHQVAILATTARVDEADLRGLPVIPVSTTMGAARVMA